MPGTQRRACRVCQRPVWIDVTLSTSAPGREGVLEQKTVITRLPVQPVPEVTVVPEPATVVGAVTRPPRERARRPTRELQVASLEPGTTLAGLSLTARIGSGGMGTVWLARQLSLDRNVAVKVLRPHLGEDPAFVIQFTREALAAAQLVHHHIVQIHDIGFDQGVHFFSMEYVEGEPLSAVRRREGRLEPAVAAGYVLQAARGLAFAHAQGIVHRDIKPDNLLLNRDGLVKVADLGLVKHVGARPAPRRLDTSTVVEANFDDAELIGTPAYMAPEQVLDAGSVDLRADVYALGCTFYDLLTGRPPFEGEGMPQLISQHLHVDPVAPIERNPRVPVELSQLVLRMLAKQRAQRPRDMNEVVGVLERFLGVEASSFSPKEEHAMLLETAVEDFSAARWAKRRRVVRAVFLAGALAVVVGAAVLGFPGFAAWAALFIGTASLTSFFINASLVRAPLLLKLRHLLLGAPVRAWAVGFSVLGVALGVLGWRGLLPGLAQNLALAAATGLASFLLLDRRVAKERRPFVDTVEQMLKGMRLKGLEEEKLRAFVCRYSGARWEEFYEALFGYDAKLCTGPHCSRGSVPRRFRGSARDARRPAASGGAVMA